MLWTGSDALYLAMYPPSKKRKYIYMFCVRLYAKLTDFFVQCHLVNHEGLRNALIKGGMKKPIYVMEDKFNTTIYKKKDSKIFIILFYLPQIKNQPYADWIYGKEYYDAIKTRFNVLVVDGTADMKDVYPIVDCYIKINKTKYNAINRIGKECKLNNIPVLLVNDYEKDFKTNLEGLVKWINTKKDISTTKQ